MDGDTVHQLKGRTGRPRLTTLTTGVGELNTSTAEQCPCSIFSQRHNIEDCSISKALNVNERAHLAKEKRLCFLASGTPPIMITWPNHVLFEDDAE